MPINTVRLNCTNFFTYFAFHPNDKQLNSKDRKTAKLATVLFAFSIIGHAICRLFAYKKITPTYTKTTNKTQSESTKHFSKDKKPSGSEKNSEKSSSSSQSQEASSEKSERDTKKPRSTCQFVLKELMNGKRSSKSLPRLFELDNLDPKHSSVCDADSFKEIFLLSCWPKNAYDLFRTTPLLDWPFLSKAVYTKLTKNEIGAKRAIKKVDALVDERIAQFDEIFQVKERILLLKEKDHLKHLTMQDLEVPFYQSAFIGAVCSNEDLAEIDFSNTIPQKVLAMIKHRLPTLKKVPVDVIPRDLANLTLQQLHSFSGKQLSRLIDVLPLQAIQLISDEQIKEMSFSKLSGPEGQRIFKGLFPLPSVTSKNSRLDLLTIDQIHSCWQVLDEDRISLLSDDILQQIDFEHYPLSNRQFDALFPSHRELADPVKERKASRIRLLSIDQIEACRHHLSDIYISYFSDLQLTNLPLDFFEPVNDAAREAFSGIFYNPKFDFKDAARRMEQLSSKQIEAYWPLFGTNIVFITPQQLEKIDFKKYPLTQGQFSALFEISKQDTHRNTIKNSRVQELSKQQIKDCWKLFNEATLRCLSDLQVKELDYSLFKDAKLLRAIFGDISRFDHIGVERMALLDMNQLADCWDILDDDLFSLLSNAQVQRLNLPLSQTQFDYLFPKEIGNKPWESSKIQFLNVKMIAKNLKYFDADRIQYLTTDQLKELDFSIFQTEEGHDLIKNLFSANTVAEWNRSCELYKMLDSDQKGIVQGIVEKNVGKALEGK